MYVIKRNGKHVPVVYSKIQSRLTKLCYGLDPIVDAAEISKIVIAGVHSGITTRELDNLASEQTYYRSSIHPDFGVLATRIAVSDLHKSTKKLFSEVMHDLYDYIDPKTNKKASLIDEKVYQFVLKNKDQLDHAVVHDRDSLFDYFGFKTLARAYLLKTNGQIAERPQHMWMRVSCGIHYPVNDKENIDECIKNVIETYNKMSLKQFIHGTPTLYNAGTPRPQMSSCFLLTMAEDSIDGIFETLKQCALISKYAGGIGLSVHNIRGTKSYIRGTNGVSNGLVPMLRVFNQTAKYVDQCVIPKTLIHTDQGLQRIDSLKPGDRVWTHTGQFQPITKLLKHNVKNEQMFEIKCKHSSNPLFITSHHPLLTSQGTIGSIEWEDVKNLNLNDYVIFPKGNNEIKYDIETKKHTMSKIEYIKPMGKYTGILYDLEVQNDHSYVTENGILHNGGGKRNGSFAIYLEPWHVDIMDFLQLKKNSGMEEFRARDLFLALWIPDLFMKRVQKNEMWSLMCPDQCPKLYDCYGQDFETLYEQYEKEKKYSKQIQAREVWNAICESQLETGVPYLLYKDACNLKSNQSNLGTIRSSNLCVSGDTMLLTDKGFFPIKTVKDQKVTIWNGTEWSSTEVKQTGVNQELLLVKLSNGTEIKCTPQHKFLMAFGYDRRYKKRKLKRKLEQETKTITRICESCSLDMQQILGSSHSN